LKFNNQLRTNVNQQKSRVNKTAANAAQLAKGILLYAYSRITASSQLLEQTRTS